MAPLDLFGIQKRSHAIPVDDRFHTVYPPTISIDNKNIYIYIISNAPQPVFTSNSCLNLLNAKDKITQSLKPTGFDLKRAP